MPVKLLRAYAGFASGQNATFDTVTEAALVAQGIGIYDSVASTNPAVPTVPPQGVITAGTYGPAVVTNIPIGNVALTGLETNGVAQTAFKNNLTEIFVPHWNTWTGVGVLNGTTVGTDKVVAWLFNSSGYLVSYSAITGTTTSGASTFQKLPFNETVTLTPGRYFIGVQMDTGTDTVRHVVSAMGAEPRCSSLTATASFAASLTAYLASTATVPSITVPTTYTTALAPIVQLYS